MPSTPTTMIKRFRKIGEEGSALLTALLVMGILIAISLATSMLIVREVGLTKLTLDAGKAFYGAESGVEMALLELEENLPGYEVEEGDDDGFFELGGENGDEVEVQYSIANKASVYPYFDEEEFDLSSVGVENVEALYDVLELNESITVPLFTVGEDGEEVPVTEFRVQYFVKFNPQSDLRISATADILSGWDVLRWKIFGVTDSLTDAQTESINDFTAVTVDATTDAQTDAQVPTWFGSVPCGPGYDFDDEISCVDYAGISNANSLRGNNIVEGQYVYDVICTPTQAREFYSYDGQGVVDVKPCYEIEEFLEGHRFNYLTLTNLMNPAVFKNEYTYKKVLELSRLYFRVEAYDGDLEREYASVSSTGESGDSRIDLAVQKRRGYYLPVMNFALYHTKDAVR
jgi:hypothetical protein